MENPIKMDDLGGTPIFGNIHFMVHVTMVGVATFSQEEESRVAFKFRILTGALLVYTAFCGIVVDRKAYILPVALVRSSGFHKGAKKQHEHDGLHDANLLS